MFVIGMSLQPVFLIGIALKRYDGTAEIKCVPILFSTTFGELTFSSTANGSSAVKGFTNVAICVVGSSKQAFTAFSWEGWMKVRPPVY